MLSRTNYDTITCCYLQTWANDEPILPLPTLKMEHCQLVCDVIRRSDSRGKWNALWLLCYKCQCHRLPRGSAPTPTHSHKHTHNMGVDLGLFWVASSAAPQVPWGWWYRWLKKVRSHTLTHTIHRWRGATLWTGLHRVDAAGVLYETWSENTNAFWEIPRFLDVAMSFKEFFSI